MCQLDSGSGEFSYIILQEVNWSTICFDDQLIILTTSEMSNNYENIVGFERWKNCVRDSDGSLFVLRNVIFVQYVIQVELALNLDSKPNILCDLISRPHLFLRTCIIGIICLHPLSLSSDDSLRIIVWIKWSKLDVVLSEGIDWEIDLVGLLRGQIEVHEGTIS